MSKTLNELFNELKSRRLDQGRRLEMRNELANYARANQQRESGRQSFWAGIGSKFITVPALAIALILALSGALSAAAQTALPGQILYPIKTGVNEPIRLALAGSLQSKAQLHAEFAQTRLEEAETLASQSKLSAQVSAALAQNFQSQASSTSVFIDRLKASGDLNDAAEISSSFESSIRAHEVILQQLQSESEKHGQNQGEANGRGDGEVGDILNIVQHKSQQVFEDRVSAESALTATSSPLVQTAAEGKQKAAQNKIDEIQRFLEQNSAHLSASAVAQAGARLADARQILADGQAKLQAQEFGDAFEKFQEAQRTAQEAKLLLRAGINLNLDLNFQKQGGAQPDGQGDASGNPEGPGSGQADQQGPDSNASGKSGDQSASGGSGESGTSTSSTSTQSSQEHHGQGGSDDSGHLDLNLGL